MSAFSREFFSFIEVARQHSIRRAAENLNVSASALSRQMQLLERDFGTRLFVRVPQGVQLTEQGRLLLRRAEKWLDDESGVRAEMRGLHAQTSASLRLGVMECLIPFLGATLDRHTTSPVKVIVGDSAALVDMLTSNRLDAVIAFNLSRQPELRVHAEREDSLGVVYSRSMAPSGDPPFRLEQCLDRPLCLPDAALSVWPRLEAAIYNAHANPQIVLRTNSIALILDYLRAGRGISFLNWLDVAVPFSRDDLCFAPLESKRLSERIGLVTATNAPIDPDVLKLARALFDAIPSPPPHDSVR